MSESQSNGSARDESGRGAAAEDEKQETSIWEWMIGYLGFILVVGSVGYLIFTAAGDRSPPSLVVMAGAGRAVDDGYLVPFRIQNRGGSTAEAVMVEGELKEGDRTVETSEATVSFVPSHSERRGGLFFSKNPRDYEVATRALGYQEP